MNQSLSIRNQNQHSKHHSYTGPGAYLQQMMSGTTYQKFIDDRGTANITAEEIAALYSNVLAT